MKILLIYQDPEYEQILKDFNFIINLLKKKFLLTQDLDYYLKIWMKICLIIKAIIAFIMVIIDFIR